MQLCVARKSVKTISGDSVGHKEYCSKQEMQRAIKPLGHSTQSKQPKLSRAAEGGDGDGDGDGDRVSHPLLLEPLVRQKPKCN